MHIICLVALYTPERQPFLDGKTYAQIPGQFVPSFFWSGKPPAHISTYTLSIYYGLQSEEGTQTTTIGFGMLAEAYANYGFIGVGVLAFLLGAFYKKVQVITANSPILSYPGLFLIVLMAWSFQTEWPVSMWLSSMYQACVGVMGVPFILRNFVGE
jgi:oligosaccharide repeat unit polymerase